MADLRVASRALRAAARAWAAETGEYYHQLDGELGGLWRRNGRPPQRLAGVGFSAQGLFEGSHYRRLSAADDPAVSWIFDGVPDTVIGDFGLSGGGAAGFAAGRRPPRPAAARAAACSVDLETTRSGVGTADSARSWVDLASSLRRQSSPARQPSTPPAPAPALKP